MVKNPPARDKGDVGSVPGLGRSPEGGDGNSCCYPCSKFHGQKEAGGLQSMGSQRVAHNMLTTHLCHIQKRCFPK